MAAPIFLGATITPITPVVAVPTTAAHWAVYNTAPVGGPSLTILTVSSSMIVTSGAASGRQVYAHLSMGPVFKMSGTAAAGPQCLTQPWTKSVGFVATAVSITNDSIWHPCTPNMNDGAATAGVALGCYAKVAGLYVVPPQGLFSLAVVCNAVGGSVTDNLYVTWSEA